MFTENHKVVSLLGPTADYNGSTLDSAAFSLANYELGTILLAHKGGTTGKSTLTVLASTSNAGAGATAIPFNYRRKTTGASAVWGAITAATAAGIDTVPAEDTQIEIFIHSAELPDGKYFVNLHCVEAVNDPVTGCIIAICSKPRYSAITNMPSPLV